VNDQTLNILGQQVPIALLLVVFQDWVKRQSWFPWLTYEKDRANRVFALVATGLATVGIHMNLNTVGHTLTITWPALPVFLLGLWHWAQQYVLTKVSYKALQPRLNNGNGKNVTPSPASPPSGGKP